MYAIVTKDEYMTMQYLSPNNSVALFCDVNDAYNALNKFADYTRNFYKIVQLNAAFDLVNTDD
jgi:hypothetical protein